MSDPSWQPSCSLAALKARAQLLCQIRAFFSERNVLEVDTPLVCATTATDPYLDSIAVPAGAMASLVGHSQLYLQTSPEFCMKRLLASGSGPIYQICKAFREGERGERHNPEFTLLEWYRPGFDESDLMDEVESLLHRFIEFDVTERISYRELFKRHLSLDPFLVSTDDLLARVKKDIPVDTEGLDRDVLLDLLLTHHVEPLIGLRCPTFIYDYPASQAALAKKAVVGGVEVGRRFELYIAGVEIANGYFELTDSEEQKLRFMDDVQKREKENLDSVPIDKRLLAALSSGLPDCSGVALGLDRLLMQMMKVSSIDEVLAFPVERA